MKPKVAFFDFASCEGCQLQVVNLEEKILDLIDIVEIVSFREAMKEHSDDYEIAFIEGSIQRPMDEERLKKIRKNAKILVALGACACIGGVNRMRNEWPVEDVKKEGRHSVLFMLTDVVKEGTELIVLSDEPAVIETAFGGKIANGTMWVAGMMSRKKQTVPPLQKAFGC